MKDLTLEDALSVALEKRLAGLADLNKYLKSDGFSEEEEPLPGPADELSIKAVEDKLGFKLGEVGDLLRLIDGIPQWEGLFTLFGTEAYLSDEYAEAFDLFELYRDGARGHGHGEDFWDYPEPEDCLLFARNPESYDLFFCYVIDGVAAGPFIWKAIDEVRRADTLAEFLTCEDED